jgi:hypothetical protein
VTIGVFSARSPDMGGYGDRECNYENGDERLFGFSAF